MFVVCGSLLLAAGSLERDETGKRDPTMASARIATNRGGM